jgi:SAM-dependent methyltransferase
VTHDPEPSNSLLHGAGDGWTETAYADAAGYLRHRAELVMRLGPPLQAGDTVLDLACGDGGLARFLPVGIRYTGVDASEAMVAAARARGVDAVHADLNDYNPPRPVSATTCFRAIYYARDRRRLFERIAGYTERKLVFDLNPRQFAPADVRADLRAAGFARLDIRPFFAPQTVALPAPAAATLRALERVGPLARLLLRFKFTYLCAASR